jgi:hypothetical protein
VGTLTAMNWTLHGCSGIDIEERLHKAIERVCRISYLESEKSFLALETTNSSEERYYALISHLPHVSNLLI